MAPFFSCIRALVAFTLAALAWGGSEVPEQSCRQSRLADETLLLQVKSKPHIVDDKINLKQSDFVEGTYRITKSGTYKLAEDTVLDPRPDASGMSWPQTLEDSEDQEEWEGVLAEIDAVKHKSAVAHGRAPPRVCIMGRAVPQIYVLGVQKAGTTTLAGDLFRAGLEQVSTRKEFHMFDGPCGFDRDNIPPDYGVCDVRTFNVSAWAHYFRPCDRDAGGPVADLTPINSRLRKLPSLLSSVYGAKKANLTFVLELREPLGRFHSGFYQEKRMYKEMYEETLKGLTFAGFAQRARELWRQLSAARDLEGLASQYPTDALYRSMYGTSLAPWLEGAFEPHQFLIVPCTRYWESLDFRRSVVAELSEMSGASLYPERILRVGNPLNSYPHPSLEEDLSEDASTAMRREFFDPDTQRLAELLAPAVKRGLRIAGYSGPPDAAAIRQYLTSTW